MRSAMRFGRLEGKENRGTHPVKNKAGGAGAGRKTDRTNNGAADTMPMRFRCGGDHSNIQQEQPASAPDPLEERPGATGILRAGETSKVRRQASHISQI